MGSKDYWVNFWQKHGENTKESDDEQKQVLRTYNKKPIGPELWEMTLQDIQSHIKPNNNDIILDLCSGNGLIARRFSSVCHSVIAVDISSDLLGALKNSTYHNIKPIVSDIREIEFEPNSFSKVIIYAGIQYLSHKETVLLFEKVYKWLKPSGIFFIGDVPDNSKKWNFFNTKDRQADYFDNLKKGKAIIGTWFEPEFFENLGIYSGFNEIEFILQRKELIYSSFRFDYKMTK